jgi:hypothetical protein
MLPHIIVAPLHNDFVYLRSHVTVLYRRRWKTITCMIFIVASMLLKQNMGPPIYSFACFRHLINAFFYISFHHMKKPIDENAWNQASCTIVYIYWVLSQDHVYCIFYSFGQLFLSCNCNICFFSCLFIEFGDYGRMYRTVQNTVTRLCTHWDGCNWHKLETPIYMWNEPYVSNFHWTYTFKEYLYHVCAI